MIAVLAALAFAVALVERSVGGVDTLVLGLLLLALHHAVGERLPWRR